MTIALSNLFRVHYIKKRKQHNRKNEVAKIEIASVTQKTAIMNETAAALISSGFISFGGSIEIKRTKENNPKKNPIIFFLLIIFLHLQKDK